MVFCPGAGNLWISTLAGALGANLSPKETVLSAGGWRKRFESTIGTLSGENGLKNARRDQRQVGVNFERLYPNKPELEAHRLLFTTFLERANEFEFAGEGGRGYPPGLAPAYLPDRAALQGRTQPGGFKYRPEGFFHWSAHQRAGNLPEHRSLEF